MFDVPIDSWYTWLGVATVSLFLLGTAVALPTAPPPSAERAAATIDRVATSDRGASATLHLEAKQIKLDSSRIALRTPAGTSHATVAFGPVTPVVPGSALEQVLAGAAPADRFGSPAAFARAAARARNRPATWRPAGNELRIRRVTWGGVDVTLVGV